jgi:large subunit ribosomal protein L7/L12
MQNKNKKIKILLTILFELSLIDISIIIKILEKKFDINSLLSTKSLKNTASEKNLEDIKEIIEEKILFNLILSEIPGDKKISILKIVRNVTGLGLKESKEIIENLPKILKEGITKEEIEKIKTEIESFGGKILIE